jgi:Fe-S cluster assembly iron-binding protein IscA
MLTLTMDATDAIRELVEDAELPETGGIRMDLVDPDTDSAPAGLLISLVTQPETQDEVVEEGGARVYLAPGIAELVSDKALDANVDGQEVTFVLTDGDDLV